MNENLIDDAVHLNNPAAQSSKADSLSEQETDATRIPRETPPIEVDFDVLLEKNEDKVKYNQPDEVVIALAGAFAQWDTV